MNDPTELESRLTTEQLHHRRWIRQKYAKRARRGILWTLGAIVGFFTLNLLFLAGVVWVIATVWQAVVR